MLRNDSIGSEKHYLDFEAPIEKTKKKEFNDFEYVLEDSQNIKSFDLDAPNLNPVNDSELEFDLSDLEF